MKITTKLKSIFTAFFVIFFFLSPMFPGLSVLAEDNHPSGVPKPSETEHEGDDHDHDHDNRLTCQQKLDALTLKVNQLVTLAGAEQSRLDTMTAMVINFYNTMFVPNGIILPDFDALVAKITDQKNMLQPALDKLQADLALLTCPVSGRDAFDQVKSDIKDVKKILRDEKNALKNLLEEMIEAFINFQPSVTPTSTVAPTETVTPTDTVVPTDTVTPTDTVVPTNTVTPTDTVVPTDTVTPTEAPSPTP